MSDLTDRLSDLERGSPSSEVFFDLANKRERLSTLESQQARPGFWSNQERARTRGAGRSRS